jgi:hypothetical protein
MAIAEVVTSLLPADAGRVAPRGFPERAKVGNVAAKQAIGPLIKGGYLRTAGHHSKDEQEQA